MRKRLAAIALLAGMVGMVAGAPSATAASGAECVVAGGVTLTTPLNSLVTGVSGTFNFTDAVLSCAGTINGSTVVPSDSAVTASGPYGGTPLGPIASDTCQFGQSSGGFNQAGTTASFNASVNAVGGGSLAVNGAFNFIRLGTMVLIKGNAGGAPMVGVFAFLPALGQTCATSAVTSAAVDGVAIIAG